MGSIVDAHIKKDLNVIFN